VPVVGLTTCPDVVVPLPLPLSAILILVIDLGFELFVAVRSSALMDGNSY